MISAENLAWMWREVNARIGTHYTWGGTLDPDDPSKGTDCSGAVGFVIEALLDGPDMNWDRPFWTGTFAGMRPGQVAQPWGLVCIARPSDAPADAAAIVAINQGPSADTSHMIVRVLDRSLDPEGIDIEDAGNGFQKYDKAASITDAQFNQWFYLPGPLEQPAPTGLTAETLSQAMGSSLAVTRYAELLRPVKDALRQCDCTTLNRLAMWMAQIGHESGGLKYMEEIADGSAYEGRGDLGNTQPGDGRKFKGRGPIQVTGRANYAALSAWAFGQGLVPTVTFFTDEPEQLASDTYGFVGVVWYWTVARDMNSYADARDIVGATRAVNGGTNGLDDRTARWNRCLAMGFDALSVSAAIPDTGGFLMALTDAEQHELLDLVRQEAKYPRDSRSPLRRLGEHNVDTILGLEWNTDANVHVLVMEALAALGHPPTLAHLNEIANADPQQWPDRQEDRKLAQAILTKIQMPGATTTTVVQQVNPVVPQQVSPSQDNTIAVSPAPVPGGSLGDDFSLLHTQLRSLTDALAELSSAFLGRK